MSEVGEHPAAPLSAFEDRHHRLRAVVGGGDRLHAESGHPEHRARREQAGGDPSEGFFRALMGSARHQERPAVAAVEDAGAADVVGVVVGDEDGLDAAGFASGVSDEFFDALSGESGVDEDGAFGGFGVEGVS
jgi:hypothetical protein